MPFGPGLSCFAPSPGDAGSRPLRASIPIAGAAAASRRFEGAWSRGHRSGRREPGHAIREVPKPGMCARQRGRRAPALTPGPRPASRGLGLDTVTGSKSIDAPPRLAQSSSSRRLGTSTPPSCRPTRGRRPRGGALPARRRPPRTGGPGESRAALGRDRETPPSLLPRAGGNADGAQSCASLSSPSAGPREYHPHESRPSCIPVPKVNQSA